MLPEKAARSRPLYTLDLAFRALMNPWSEQARVDTVFNPNHEAQTFRYVLQYQDGYMKTSSF